MGLVKKHNSGFGGRGHLFDEREESKRMATVNLFGSEAITSEETKPFTKCNFVPAKQYSKLNAAAEIEINDIPKAARLEIPNRSTLARIKGRINISVIVRGRYLQEETVGERKLHLYVEGSAEEDILLFHSELEHEIRHIINNS
ncbi:hypothetical protein ADUPG1_013863 [Aduncisulcus paluster]|uniref:ATP-dependent RNA helicase PRP5/DDX46/KHDC4 KH domain-containing protein n=1 Tax=Aduncisulcus paluster TaxID=2918883 RepID=A0ABQ5K8I8_9EUKA|nr:hypothetical protein ADUPG1_013863 [Aduncisulcus paluster]